MAANGQDPEDDIWEDASDVYEVRSETGDSVPEDQSEPDDDVESSEVQIMVPPRSERAEQSRRAPNPRCERDVERFTTANPRGAVSLTPQSDYQSATLVMPPMNRVARYVLTPLPRGRSNFKPDKPRDSRTFIKPPRFEGKDNCVESHLMQFDIIAKRNQWDELEKADFLKCTLSGEASHMLRDLDETATYDDVVTKLRQRYGSLEQIESFRMELKQRKRKPGESLAHLLKDIRRLFMQAYPGPPNYMSQITAKDAFIDALDDREHQGDGARAEYVRSSLQDRRTYGALPEDAERSWTGRNGENRGQGARNDNP